MVLAISASAQGLEFRSIGSAAVVMYDAPSAKGGKLYVAPRGMPVEVVFSSGAWSKVRDVAGDLSWVETKDLITRRSLIVRAATAKLYSNADDSSTLLLVADKNVLFEMAEPASGAWVKVKHRDGQIGYLKVSEVWGL